jgi:hypothetical protein
VITLLTKEEYTTAISGTSLVTTLGSSSALITTVSVPGPQGEKGDPGDAADTPTFEAGESLSAKRAIRVEGDIAYYADGADSAHAGKALGISAGAVSLGDTVTVRMTGMVQELTWTLTEGPVYVGANGALTQSVSGLAFVQQIGVAVSPTQININPQLAILH